jgi:sugar/nucleoside kinase (ribokinase family)
MPEFDISVLLATDFTLTLGNSSAILANNLATLGTKVGFITRLGSDSLAAIAIERLTASGVDVSRVVRAEGTTATGITVLLHHGESRHVLTYPGTMTEMTCADLDFDCLVSARHFHLSSLFLQLGLYPDLPQIFGDLKRAGLTVSLDTNDDPDDRWNGVLSELLDMTDILLPNEEEACRMAYRDTPDEALAWLSRHVPMIVVKAGVARCANSTRRRAHQGGSSGGSAGRFQRRWRQLQCRLPVRVAALRRATNRGQGRQHRWRVATLRPGGTEAFRDPSLWKTFLKKHEFPGLA